jgi:hypothetical protein
MAKAARWAYELQKLCAAVADEQTMLESNAYAAYMLACLLLEKGRWAQAQKHFTSAQNMYSDLAQVETSKEVIEMFAAMSEELTPSILYCKYNARKAGDEGDEDDDALQHLLQGSLDTPALDMLKAKLKNDADSSNSAEARQLTELSWRGATLPLENVKLRMAVFTAQTELKGVDGEKGTDKKMDRFGKAMVAYDDGLTILGRDLTDLRGSSGADTTKKAQMEQLEVYLNFLKITVNVTQNLVLADSLKRGLTIAGVRQEADVETSVKATRPDELVGYSPPIPPGPHPPHAAKPSCLSTQIRLSLDSAPEGKATSAGSSTS